MLLKQQIMFKFLLVSLFSNGTVDRRHDAVNVDGRTRICLAKQFNIIFDKILQTYTSNIVVCYKIN